MSNKASVEDAEMGKRILGWLGAHDMSGARFAREAGIVPSTLYSITGGYAGTSTDTLRKICRTHRIDANWLLGLRKD